MKTEKTEETEKTKETEKLADLKYLCEQMVDDTKMLKPYRQNVADVVCRVKYYAEMIDDILNDRSLQKYKEGK